MLTKFLSASILSGLGERLTCEGEEKQTGLVFKKFLQSIILRRRLVLKETGHSSCVTATEIANYSIQANNTS